MAASARPSSGRKTSKAHLLDPPVAGYLAPRKRKSTSNIDHLYSAFAVEELSPLSTDIPWTAAVTERECASDYAALFPRGMTSGAELMYSSPEALAQVRHSSAAHRGCVDSPRLLAFTSVSPYAQWRLTFTKELV